MEVDAGADRPAKDKPVETTPQVTKKTKKDEEQKAAADSVAEGGSAPPNIPISTLKGRQEVPSSSSKTQSVPRPRRGRSRQRSNDRRGSPPISASVAVEATEAARSAAPNEGWYTKQQQQLANQGQTVVTMDMLQKCLQVVQDSQGKIEQKLDDNIKQTNKNTDRITALTRQAVYLLTEKRAAEDEQSGKQYDIVGIPEQATQEDNMGFVIYIMQEIGLTKASAKSCDVQALNNDTAGQEIWRITFKDYTPKKAINEFFKTPRNWDMEFWGTNDQILKGFRVWGRWTEGTVGKIVRDSINTIFRALTEAMGKEALWASDGCSIDYRMSGIYERIDRTPRVVIIYSEEDADPKIHIYSYPPRRPDNGRLGEAHGAALRRVHTTTRS